MTRLIKFDKAFSLVRNKVGRYVPLIDDCAFNNLKLRFKTFRILDRNRTVRTNSFDSHSNEFAQSLLTVSRDGSYRN